MKFNLLLHLYTFLSLAIVGSYAVVTPEAYWKSVLPNSRMPKAIKDLLYAQEEKTTVVSEDQLKDTKSIANLFFSETEFHQGTEMKLDFTNSQKATFLPRKVADSIPFSSSKLPEIINQLSIKPDSKEAQAMKQTLSLCGNKEIEGREAYCTTSLESMVDFTTSKLGMKVKAISTEAMNAKGSTLYRIQGVKKVAADKAVVCHKQKYPYAVHLCHKSEHIKAYVVSMAGSDGSTSKAVVACHADAAIEVDPKMNPGNGPICHFLPADDVVWIQY